MAPNRSKHFVFLGILAAIFIGMWIFALKNKQLHNEPIPNKLVNQVNAQEFDSLAENPDTFILDVHTPEQTHIPGTDAFIPYDQITQNLDQLPEDKNTPILVYCRSGSMSAQASEELAALGYKTVYDLEGGINAYRESNASVSISPLTHDFGTVIYGDVPTTQFTLTNFTPAPIKLTRISTSCGCTQAEAEKLELKPYDSTTIKISFNPAVHKDDSDLGQLTRTIYIETDSPNFPKLESTITANVIKN